jgi:hypothetical protein
VSFPIKILRGAKPALGFADAVELRRWINAEATFWHWLIDHEFWGNPRLRDDSSLRNKVIEALWSPLAELQGLTAEGETLDDSVADAAYSLLVRAYTDGPVPTRVDPGAESILAAAKEDPPYALGMLAQALGVSVESESAAAFSGRQGWIARLPGALAAGIDKRLDDLRMRFDRANQQLDNRQLAATAARQLSELEMARDVNTWWVFGLAVAALLWIGLATYGIGCVHRLTLSTSTPPEWGPQVAERAALFLFLMTAFSWGMRWIGRMIQDAWAARQSTARRYTALKVVLDDTEARLVKGTEKDWDRVRAEIFGDGEASVVASAKEEKKDKGAETDGDSLDIAKKVVALLKDMQSLVPGSGKP